MADRVGHEGQQLGNYRLLRLLGRGGFADVYLGQHIHLNSHAAVKILRTQFPDEDAQQFIREAQILALFSHPHIVRILDFAIQGRANRQCDGEVMVFDRAIHLVPETWAGRGNASQQFAGPGSGNSDTET